jgi:hypothetical protein
MADSQWCAQFGIHHTGTNEEIVTATIDPIGSRTERRGNPFNQPLRDRRFDLYGETLGSAHAPGPY